MRKLRETSREFRGGLRPEKGHDNIDVGIVSPQRITGEDCESGPAQQVVEQGNVGSEDSGVSSLNNSTAGSRTSGRPGRPQYRT